MGIISFHWLYRGYGTAIIIHIHSPYVKEEPFWLIPEVISTCSKVLVFHVMRVSIFHVMRVSIVDGFYGKMRYIEEDSLEVTLPCHRGTFPHLLNHPFQSEPSLSEQCMWYWHKATLWHLPFISISAGISDNAPAKIMAWFSSLDGTHHYIRSDSAKEIIKILQHFKPFWSFQPIRG